MASKDYVDRGVQTCDISCPSAPVQLSGGLTDPLNPRKLSLSSRTSSRSLLPARSSINGSHSRVSTPSPSPLTYQSKSAQNFKPTVAARIPRNSRISSLSSLSPLVTSISGYENARSRVVSQPERTLASNSSSDKSHSLSRNISHKTDPPLSNSAVLIASPRPLSFQSPFRSHESFPQTPCPPSSPESVLIIDNAPPLSKGFLRGGSLSPPPSEDAEIEGMYAAFMTNVPTQS